jgi:hypothetical protein
VLYDLLEDRIITIIDEFSLDDMEKLLVIYANLEKKRQTTIFNAVEHFILENKEKIKRNSIPEIFFLFCQNEQGSTRFYDSMQEFIISFLYHLDRQVPSLYSNWSTVCGDLPRDILLNLLFFSKKP